jgi:hypothetical protein
MKKTQKEVISMYEKAYNMHQGQIQRFYDLQQNPEKSEHVAKRARPQAGLMSQKKKPARRGAATRSTTILGGLSQRLKNKMGV